MGIKLNPHKQIIQRLKVDKNGPANIYLAQRAQVRMNARYVPEDTGVLHDTSYVDKTDCSIHYDQQYAGYQYYGKRKDGSHVIVNHTKAGTGPYWDKLMMSAEGKDLEKDINDYIKGKV